MHVPRRVVKLDEAALIQHSDTLDAAAEFCAWMLWYYISDRTTLLPYAAKSYSRDIVATVYAVMVLVAFAGSMRKEKRVMTLSRQQTEEWKGWMQVCLCTAEFAAQQSCLQLPWHAAQHPCIC